MGEFRAELAQEFNVDVVDTGETSETHSGGVVVLRCTAGLGGTGWPGGLQVLDKARRCDLDTFTVGSTLWSWVRILGSSVGPLCRSGERLGVVACVSTESGDEF